MLSSLWIPKPARGVSSLGASLSKDAVSSSVEVEGVDDEFDGGIRLSPCEWAF